MINDFHPVLAKSFPKITGQSAHDKDHGSECRNNALLVNASLVTDIFPCVVSYTCGYREILVSGPTHS